MLQEGVAGPWGAEGFKALVVKCTLAPLVVAATVFAQTFLHLWHACSGAPAQCKPIWECALGCCLEERWERIKQEVLLPSTQQALCLTVR